MHFAQIAISSCPIVIRSADPHPRLDRSLHLVHGFLERLVNQFLNFLIPGFCQVHANAFWNRERESDADTPIINLFCLRERFLGHLVDFPYDVLRLSLARAVSLSPGCGIRLFAIATKSSLVRSTCQPETLGSFPIPHAIFCRVKFAGR
jgi:hypothetical protein